MIVREVLPEEKKQFNSVATHPLQSWEWGEFRQKTGIRVIRLGTFDENKLIAGYQLTVHPVPAIGDNIIYFPKGPMPDRPMFDALEKIGVLEKAILIKIEPNVLANPDVRKFLLKNNCREGQPLFTRYTFILDLAKTEDQLLAEMKPKTRYNIRLAQKHKVEVSEDNSSDTFETYLKLMQETTRRQGFYAHTPEYHRKMWQTLNPPGIARLFKASYHGQVLATYIFFVFNKVLYYPYGASTRIHKEVMSTYALFWEAIKFGKKLGCRSFDMWGTPGPNPSPKDPWFGFHRFKEGFGAKLVEFIGTYDLVIKPYLYPLFNLTNNLRWRLLRLKAKLPF